MSVDQTTEQRVLDAERYIVMHRDEDLGVAIVQNPSGGYELWERVDDYRGEILIINDQTYRFLRTWKGSRNTS